MSKRTAKQLTQIASVLPAYALKPLKARGFNDYDIIANWANIVGPKWAELSRPDKITFFNKTRKGIIYIRVYASAAVLLQQISQEIIDRVNSYIGFNAIEKISLIQDYNLTPKKPTVESLKPSETVADQRIEAIEDPELKEALYNLKASMSA